METRWTNGQIINNPNIYHRSLHPLIKLFFVPGAILLPYSYLLGRYYRYGTKLTENIYVLRFLNSPDQLTLPTREMRLIVHLDSRSTGLVLTIKTTPSIIGGRSLSGVEGTIVHRTKP